MKIIIRGFLTLREVMGDQSALELETCDLTLIELLSELAHRFDDRFSKIIFDETGKRLNPHIRILINGRHYSHIPQKLNTRLQEGDEVALFPPVAGG